MNRLLYCILLCLLYLYSSYVPALATMNAASSYAMQSVLNQFPPAGSTSAGTAPTGSAFATTTSPYQNVVLQLYQAINGTAPNAQTLTSLENALSAANAPTDAAGLEAAYSTNTAVKSIIDSLGNKSSSTTTETFVANIFVNVTGHQPAVAGLTFWVNAINSGSVTVADAALAILAGALTSNTASIAITAPTVPVTNTEVSQVDDNTLSVVNTELDITPTTPWQSILDAIQNHPYITTIVLAGVATAISTSIAIPLGVRSIQASQRRTSQNNLLKQLEAYNYQNYVKSQQLSTTVMKSGGGGGPAPPPQ